MTKQYFRCRVKVNTRLFAIKFQKFCFTLRYSFVILRVTCDFNFPLDKLKKLIKTKLVHYDLKKNSMKCKKKHVSITAFQK